MFIRFKQAADLKKKLLIFKTILYFMLCDFQWENKKIQKNFKSYTAIKTQTRETSITCFTPAKMLKWK